MPWDITSFWELLGCELLSMAAAWDLCPPEWSAISRAMTLACAVALPAFPDISPPLLESHLAQAQARG